MQKFVLLLLSLRPVTLILPLIIIAGCSTPKSAPGQTGALHTHIRNDGTKLFVFTSRYIPRTSARVGSKNTTGEAGQSNPHRAPRQEQHTSTSIRRQNSGGRTGNGFREQILKALDERLAQTGYCREGYLPLGSYIEFGQFEIRGECHETATKQDKVIFPDSAAL